MISRPPPPPKTQEINRHHTPLHIRAKVNRLDRSIHPTEKFPFERSHQTNGNGQLIQTSYRFLTTDPATRQSGGIERREGEEKTTVDRGRCSGTRIATKREKARREEARRSSPRKMRGNWGAEPKPQLRRRRERHPQHRGPYFFACGPRVRRPMVPMVEGGPACACACACAMWCRGGVPIQLQESGQGSRRV